MSTVTPEVIERVETALRFATDRKYLATAIDLGDIRALLAVAKASTARTAAIGTTNLVSAVYPDRVAASRPDPDARPEPQP